MYIYEYYNLRYIPDHLHTLRAYSHEYLIYGHTLESKIKTAAQHQKF